MFFYDDWPYQNCIWLPEVSGPDGGAAIYLKFSAWAWVHISSYIWYESEEICFLTDGMVSYVFRNLSKGFKDIASSKNPTE